MRLTLLLLALSACGAISSAQSASRPVEVPLVGTNGTVGRVIFRQTMKGDLNIDVKVGALTRGEHAIHVHLYPVCESPDFKTAGPHFNPTDKKHGWRSPLGHHAGDLPENLIVDANGDGEANFTVSTLSLTPGVANSILGHSFVVHERADDMRTDPSGNSGNRIACGIIGPT